MYMYVHFCRFTLGCFQKRSNTSGTIHEICKKEFCIFHIVLEWFVWKTILIHWEKWSLWFAWLVRKVFCKCLFNKHFIGKDTVWYFTCFSLFLEKYIFDFYNQLLDKILARYLRSVYFWWNLRVLVWNYTYKKEVCAFSTSIR